jgi:threonine dehydrogenase-like Zn-dependent dehydrogenase
MRAILRVRPGEVAVVDRPTPEPGPGEVLVRLRACGICGSDLARLRDPDEKWNRVVLGHECSGVVESVGRGLVPRRVGQGTSPRPTVGDRVALLPLLPDFTCPYCRRGDFSLCDGYSFFGSRKDGGLAEYLVVPATNVLPLPDEVDDETAAMLEPLSVATKACLLARLDCRARARSAPDRAGYKPPPYSVLIMGAGAIGLLAVQVALALGASPVIACDVIPERLALAAALGAETVLLPSDTSDFRLPTCDLCLECSGHHAAFSPALDSLAKGGTLVLVGTGPGAVALTGEQREQICRRMLTVRGQWMSYGPTWPGEPWTLPLALLAEGRLDPKRLLTHRFPLAQTPEAVRFMLTPGADYLKVMITM